MLPFFIILKRGQSSVKINPRLHWFFFTSLCDQSRKIASASQPIRCKTKTNRDLVTRALGGLVTLTLSSHWILKVFFFLTIGCGDFFGFALRHSIEKCSVFLPAEAKRYGTKTCGSELHSPRIRDVVFLVNQTSLNQFQVFPYWKLEKIPQ